MTPTASSAPSPTRSERIGLAYTLAAFLMWGVFPIYWKALSGVDPLTILAHRILWSGVFGFVMLRLLRTRGLGALFTRGPALAAVAVSGLLVGVNWFLYIFAVNSGHTVEASLGYYMTPVCNVTLGVLFLRERPGPLQWGAIACSLVGVGVLVVGVGHVPWLSLALMITFGLYGLMKKITRTDALVQLTGETFLLAPAALLVVAWPYLAGGSLGAVFGWAPTDPSGLFQLGHGTAETILLVVAGPVTALPLWWYAEGARRIPLSTVGVLQFVSPSLQLGMGVLVFGEPFGSAQALAFAFIWAGLALYVFSFWHRRP